MDRGRNDLQNSAVGGEDCALHQIFQFADVAGPVVLFKSPERLFADRSDRTFESRVVLINEMAREQRDVTQPVAQRGQSDREDIKAVKKVGAEFAFVDQSLERLIGRGYDTDFDANALRAAQSLEDAGLQHAQEPPLYLQRDLADFIQKDRAAVGQLESPRLGRLRSGEGP